MDGREVVVLHLNWCLGLLFFVVVVVVVVFCDSKLPLPQTLSFRKVGLCNAVGSPDIRCLL